ncbi:MAG TPA: glycosyltransferase family 4 protein [Nitrososphaerales archaeon]|nr:glycosyltransferase family 4 protein [Nitrososphaerales archaeon]
MRILLVSSSFFPKIDGSTRCVYDHGRKLALRKNLVYLVTRGIKGVPKEEDYEGIHVVRTPFQYQGGTLAKRAALMVQQALAVFLVARGMKASVIHVHGYAAALAAFPTKYIFRIPMVITTHGTELLWPREVWWKSSTEIKLGLIFEKFVLKHCDVVIAQSKGVREYMLKIYSPAIESKIRLIHTGVDHEKFKAPVRTEPTKKIMFVGALSEVKGVTCLIDAFQGVHEAVPDSSLHLVGSGPRARAYREYAKKLNLDGAVEFEGPVRDDNRLLELYSESDIVVLPSNVGGPISVTLLEGMSMGRAVISTNVPGGIPDVLGDGSGLLMERGNKSQLEDYLRRLVTDRGFLLTMKERSRRTVEEKYTLDSMIDKLMALYREVAA